MQKAATSDGARAPSAVERLHLAVYGPECLDGPVLAFCTNRDQLLHDAADRIAGLEQKYVELKREVDLPLAAYSRLDRLANVLYGRPPRGRDYIGGADAHILEDAAVRIQELQEELRSRRKPRGRR